MAIQEVEKNIQVLSTPFKFLGTQFGNRMTIIRLPENKLWIHSPVQITQDHIKEIRSLGDVTYIVSPNLFHYLHVKSFLTAFPNHQFYGVAGIEKKIKHHGPIISLEDTVDDNLWGPEIESVVIDGMPKVNEVAFFHTSSQTLVLTDLLFNFRNTKGWSKFLFSLYGVNERLATSKLYRSLINDKQAFKSSIEKIMSWDFNKIVVSHGELIESDGKNAFRKSFDWLL